MRCGADSVKQYHRGNTKRLKKHARAGGKNSVCRTKIDDYFPRKNKGDRGSEGGVNPVGVSTLEAKTQIRFVQACDIPHPIR